ncbi:hypothetical protein OFN21_32245, partial [Escherichia coli]|nr:hypothetical protein [Escherichia coli]
MKVLTHHPSALFGAAEAWLKSQGASKISGPFSLNINQESGLLIEGFDTPPFRVVWRSGSVVEV